jgi:putative signal transducing protein
MARDGYLTLGTLLTPEEAGMAHDLLASAGVDALLEDQALSAVDPLVRFAIGGTKLLVREEDAERARALLDEAGVLAPASARPAEEVEIPEEEWSARPPEPPPEETGEPRWPGARVLMLLIVLLATAVAVLAESSRPRWPPWGR